MIPKTSNVIQGIEYHYYGDFYRASRPDFDAAVARAVQRARDAGAKIEPRAAGRFRCSLADYPTVTHAAGDDLRVIPAALVDYQGRAMHLRAATLLLLVERGQITPAQATAIAAAAGLLRWGSIATGAIILWKIFRRK